MDEAVIFFGMEVENRLECAGHKESKDERKIKAARQTVMSKIFDDEEMQKKSFADPAAMFQ